MIPKCWSRKKSPAGRRRWAFWAARRCRWSKSVPKPAATITKTNTRPAARNIFARRTLTPRRRRIQAAALGAFRAVGGRDYARVDVMVRAGRRAGGAGSEHAAGDDGNESAAEGGGGGGVELRATLPAHGGPGDGTSGKRRPCSQIHDERRSVTMDCIRAFASAASQ